MLYAMQNTKQTAKQYCVMDFWLAVRTKLIQVDMCRCWLWSHSLVHVSVLRAQQSLVCIQLMTTYAEQHEAAQVPQPLHVSRSMSASLAWLMSIAYSPSHTSKTLDWRLSPCSLEVSDMQSLWQLGCHTWFALQCHDHTDLTPYISCVNQGQGSNKLCC